MCSAFPPELDRPHERPYEENDGINDDANPSQKMKITPCIYRFMNWETEIIPFLTPLFSFCHYSSLVDLFRFCSFQDERVEEFWGEEYSVICSTRVGGYKLD